jgi:hypothetical protein
MADSVSIIPLFVNLDYGLMRVLSQQQCDSVCSLVIHHTDFLNQLPRQVLMNEKLGVAPKRPA